MSLRKELQSAFDIGKQLASEGLLLDQMFGPTAKRLADQHLVSAAYEAGYDEGRADFIFLARAYREAAKPNAK